LNLACSNEGLEEGSLLAVSGCCGFWMPLYCETKEKCGVIDGLDQAISTDGAGLQSAAKLLDALVVERGHSDRRTTQHGLQRLI
jgi:hypothetical protein